MTMTNQTMAPKVPANPVNKPHDKSQDESLAGVAQEFNDQINADAIKAAQQNQEKIANPGPPIHELTEDDAYNLKVHMDIKTVFEDDFLKLEFKDSRYIGRWGHRGSTRQAQLSAKGFKVASTADLTDECAERLSVHLDSLGHYAWSDLIAMKIPKNLYYGGIRNAFLKSLMATNNKMAREAGATHATQDLTQNLKGHERAYLERHVATTNKQVYNPNVGV